jgi:predicted Zn-dependent protease
MLDLIAVAFDRQDYDTAAQLLQQLQHNSPTDPWVQFYSGRLDEIFGRLDAAAEIYRQLLLSSGHVHAKIVAQARQGLDRIEILLKAQRQEAIAQAIADPQNTQKGVLVLEPMKSDSNS